MNVPRLTVIDWETLGLESNTKVLSLGAVTFNIDGSGQDVNFYANIELRGQENRTSTESTVKWWEEQTDEARAALHINEIPLKQTISALRAHIYIECSEGIIGNGVNFDNAILANICKETGLDYPVKYYQDYDLRTMNLMAGVAKVAWPKELTMHNALDDAIYEAMCAKHYWKSIHG